MGFTATSAGYAMWIRHEGSFNHEQWASAFGSLGMVTGRRGDAVSVEVSERSKLTVDPRVVTIDMRAFGGDIEFSRNTVGVERAVSLAERIDPADGWTGLVLEPLPEVSASDARSIPERLTIRAQPDDDGSPSHRLRCVWSGRSPDAAESFFESCRKVGDSVSELGMEFALDGKRVLLDVDITTWLDPELARALSRIVAN